MTQATKRVMVVDDEQDMQSLFQQRFRKEIRQGKIELTFLLSAEAALEYLSQQGAADCELILSDINMPGMDGLEFLKVVKSSFQDLTVIMITAYGDERSYQAAMQYGADGYIYKPIEFSALKQRIFT